MANFSKKRGARFPFGGCQSDCSNDSVKCSLCKNWYHNKCQEILDDELKMWENSDLEYVCFSCRTLDGNEFDYLMAMHCLQNEQDLAIKKELAILRQKFSQPDVTHVQESKSMFHHLDNLIQMSLGQMRDYLGRVIYCAILGYDVSFSYIHAVKLAQQGTGFEKRMGYLASSILLNDGHELIVLLINTIQKDLTSSNLLDNCIAMTATCQLVNSEMIPMLLPLVLKKLRHPRELVRLKAVVCLHRFLIQAPDIVQHILPEFERVLCDKEPGVMAATVSVYHHLIKTDPEKYISVGEKLIMIMQQILTRKMPAIFEYHSIPFPWLQIQILQCLAWVGAKVHSIGQLMIPLLKEVLQRTNMKENLAFGILYECILCITSIKPDQNLLAEAATHVGRFLHSQNPNLKYIGVKCLTALVKVDAKFALDYQTLVVESLEDGDEAVQRKMIELLYQMCNISNVQFICAKLLEQLQATTDQFWQSHILNMVTLLAEKYKVSDQWYIDIMFQTVELCNRRIGQDFVNCIITVIQSGCKADGQGRNDLQLFLMKKSIQYLLKENTCQELIQISAWVLGEFASSLKNMPADRLIKLIIKHLSDPDIDVQVKGWLITAFTKLYEAKVLSKDITLSKTQEVIQCNSSSIIRQRLTLLHQLAKHGVYAEVSVYRPNERDVAEVSVHRPNERYVAEVSVHRPNERDVAEVSVLRPNERDVANQLDFTLSFLDDFVSNALEAGMAPYKPLHLRFPAPIQTQEVQKLFIGVQDGNSPAVPSTHSSLTPDSLYKSGSVFSGEHASKNTGEVKMNLSSVKRVWGKEGLIRESPASKQDSTKTETQPVLDHDMVSEVDDMERRRQEVMSSLFSGITPASNASENTASSQRQIGASVESAKPQRLLSFINSRSTDDDKDYIYDMPKSNSAGWMTLHESVTSVGQKSIVSHETNGHWTNQLQDLSLPFAFEPLEEKTMQKGEKGKISNNYELEGINDSAKNVTGFQNPTSHGLHTVTHDSKNVTGFQNPTSHGLHTVTHDDKNFSKTDRSDDSKFKHANENTDSRNNQLNIFINNDGTKVAGLTDGELDAALTQLLSQNISDHGSVSEDCAVYTKDSAVNTKDIAAITKVTQENTEDSQMAYYELIDNNTVKQMDKPVTLEKKQGDSHSREKVNTTRPSLYDEDEGSLYDFQND